MMTPMSHLRCKGLKVTQIAQYLLVLLSIHPLTAQVVASISGVKQLSSRLRYTHVYVHIFHCFVFFFVKGFAVSNVKAHACPTLSDGQHNTQHYHTRYVLRNSLIC